MLIDDFTKKPYEQEELRSLYEGAFSKAFTDDPNRRMAHDMFSITFGTDASPHGYLITGQYSIPEENSATYAMPSSLESIAANFATEIWRRAIEAMGNALYFSFPRTERPDTNDFKAAMSSKCFSEEWGFLFLEDNLHIDFVTNTKGFLMRDAPEGFAIEGTKCYSVPKFPEGCALFLADKAPFAFASPQISLEFPSRAGGAYTFKSCIKLQSIHQPDSLLLVNPNHLLRVWEERNYSSREHFSPDMSIKRIQ